MTTRRLLVAVASVLAVAVLAVGIALPRKKTTGEASPARTADVAALTQQANEAVQAGKLREAASLLAQAKRASPGDTSILVTRANLMAQLGQSRDAMEDIKAAHQLAPEDPQITLELNRIAPQFVPAAEKEEYARLAVRQAGDKAISHYYLGLAIVAANDPRRYKDALAAFERANAIAPNQQLVPLEMGKLCCRMGDYTRGAAWLENAWLLIDTHDRDQTTPAAEVTRQRQAAAYWLAEAYRHLNKGKEAAEMAARAEKYASKVREIEALQVRAVAEPPDLDAAARLKHIEARRD